MVFFHATCRGICPLIIRNLIQIEPSFSEFHGLKIFSISINPKEDTVPVLQNYRKTYQIKNPNWSLFIRKIFFLFDKDKYLHGIYRAKGTGDVQRLIDDLKN
ncbi:SCO family protein [Leptospira noumeaensis]|uniref:SCO family protein n=1 Tax=Leptospira noumeaensis TaxID=2484964 RepID=UPI001FCA7C2C